MPKNYQISQYDEPLCAFGHLDVEVDGEVHRVGITRVHLEEDTGKSLHVGGRGRIHGATHSLLDYNRAGVPLVEIVTEPDIRSAAVAKAYLAELRDLQLGRRPPGFPGRAARPAPLARRLGGADGAGAAALRRQRLAAAAW